MASIVPHPQLAFDVLARSSAPVSRLSEAGVIMHVNLRFLVHATCECDAWWTTVGFHTDGEDWKDINNVAQKDEHLLPLQISRIFSALVHI